MSGPLGRLITVPERWPGRVVLSTGLTCAALYLAATTAFPRPGGRIIAGDAVHHFVYLRSLVFDRDLRFQNEYIRMYGLTQEVPDGDWVFRPSATGHVRNMMPIGPAVVWAPAYLAAAAVASVLALVGLAPPPDGFGLIFQACAGASGVAAATAGAWFAFLAARPLFGARVAIWATMTMWLGSSAIYYSLVSPAYSHASSMLATGLFAWAWASGGRGRGSAAEELSIGRYALLGVLAGFAALVRWQDAVFLAAPALDLAGTAVRGRGSVGNRLTRALAGGLVLGAAALVAFLPQVLAWISLYGQPFVVPQGGEFMRWGSPSLRDVLVSYKHGLFSWTPLVVVAVAGIAPLARRAPRVAAGAAVVLLASWYANAAVVDWWAGEAFGARRFVSCFPFFVLGLASVLDRWRDRPAVLAAAAGVAVGLNELLLFQYQVFMKGWRDIAPYPDTFRGLWVERFLVPFRVLGRLLGGRGA
jgi:hypothetical protein